MTLYDLMVNRRSVRIFLDKEIPENVIEKLLDVANNAPSGGNIQPISIIIVKRKESREKLVKIIGAQPWVKNAPLSMIFCLDFHRVKRWATLSNTDFQGEHSLGHFLIGYADIMCAAQNVVMTAESLQLGSVYVGSIQGTMDEIREKFSIPKYVLPLMLLSIGYPKSKPEKMPKLEKNVIVHYEKYRTLNDDDIMKAYDNKYGDFDEDVDTYLEKANIEVLEANKQESGNWLKLVKKRLKSLDIQNHAQFLFKLRYPTEAMVKQGELIFQQMKNAGFKF
ncbi:MAG: nitroreductase family protein [Candidatus Lokiarchaeota archaeon]|nr:nitroreductase family protein [Candidatus Lokiarchaeota archaeon]